MTAKFQRRVTARAFTRAQQEAWDTRSGFVGQILPAGRALSFHELVTRCEAHARTHREEPLLPEEIALQLIDLLEHELASVVITPTTRGRRVARGTRP